MRRFVLFCVGGAIGLVIDAGLAQAGTRLAGLDPWSARALSFPPALAFTWWFNRTLTFRASGGPDEGATRERPSRWREAALYASTQVAGLTVNLAVYALLVGLSPFAARWPMAAVAMGAAAGLVVNFLGAKHVVFRGA